MKTALVILVIILGGCAAAIKTPREGVAACYYTVRAAFDTAAGMKARGKLTAEREKQVLAIGDKALASCDLARVALAGGDLSKAENQLKAAELILLQLEASVK